MKRRTLKRKATKPRVRRKPLGTGAHKSLKVKARSLRKSVGQKHAISPRKPKRGSYGEFEDAVKLRESDPVRFRRSLRLQAVVANGERISAPFLAELKSLGAAFIAHVDALPPEMKNLLDGLDSNPDAPWGEMTEEDLRTLLKTAKGLKARGRPVKSSTKEKIQRIASALTQGRTGYDVAPEVFPGKQTRKAADDELRRFKHQHKDKIQQEMDRLKSAQHA